MTTPPKTLGSYLRLKRRNRRLSQRKAAKFLGYSCGQMISNWERSICHPPLAKLKAIADLYRIKEKELISILVQDYEATLETKVFQKSRKRTRHGLRLVSSENPKTKATRRSG